MTARIITNDADKDPREALSPSIAKTLIIDSPLHARWELDHPSRPSSKMSVGSAVHAMLLGVGKDIEVIDADSFRGNAAKVARDKAIFAGKAPMLAGDFERMSKAVPAIRDKLLSRGIDLSTGDSETKIEWTSPEGVLCRGVPDKVIAHVVYDLKVGEYVARENVGRKIYSEGHDIQGTAYMEAVETLRPELEDRTDFVLVFIQSDPPHGITITNMDGVFREIGQRRWARAKSMWARCQESGDWSDWSDEIIRAEPPRWAVHAEGF